MVCSDEIDFGKDGFTVEIGGEILDVWDGIAIWDGCVIQSAVIATRTPIARRGFRNHVKR